MVGCRYLTDDCLDGGTRSTTPALFGVRFAGPGMDFLSLSRGGKFEDAKQPKIGRAAYPYTGPAGYECMPTAISDAQGPFGRNRRRRRTRSASGPRGRATNADRRRGRHLRPSSRPKRILDAARRTSIAAARQSLADPDWFRKMRLGRGDAGPALHLHELLRGLDQMHKQVTCQLWDRESLDEPDVPKSKDGRRRLIPPAWSPDGP